jgi:chorismate-pyruvate lyase
VEELRHAILSAALGEFLGTSIVSEARIEWCKPEAVPQPYRDLLWHDGDMTSSLERFHGDELTLQILRVEQVKANYLREVVLRRKRDGQAVEYGVIEVVLPAFSPSMRVAIVAGGQPLGGLLNSTGMVYGSEPIGFFGIRGAEVGSIYPETPSGEILYGRYNRLINEDGLELARIVEILPKSDPKTG